MYKINNQLLDQVSAEAQANPRLRMNHNFHESPESKSQRLLNALEPGTVVPIHRHMHTSETYILLRGKLRILFYDNERKITDDFILDPTQGEYGVNIPAGQWHALEVLESGSVIFEVKDGPYTPIKSEDMLEI